MGKQIIILGGGFGGLYTALRLQELPWGDDRPDMTLIDHQDRFLFSPLLYDFLLGEMQAWEVAPSYEDLLRTTAIRFVQGKVERLDPQRREVHLAGTDRPLPYDEAVIALGGSTTHLPPGVQHYGLTFKTLADAQNLDRRLRQFLDSNGETLRIAILGGGPTGVELACTLADRLGDRGRLRIIDRSDTLLKQGQAFNRQAAAKALEDRQVWIDLETEVVALQERSLTLRYKNQEDELPADLMIWTGGGVTYGDRGWGSDHPQGKIPVDTYLRLPHQPHLWAVGDITHLPDTPLPRTAQVAIQQADFAAWNIWARLTGRSLLPFRYSDLGEMLSLGQGQGSLSGLGLSWEGPWAALARRWVYLYRLPTREHQLRVGLAWLTQPLLELLNLP